MTTPAAVTPTAADLPLRQFWWLHDARWYQGVARRFGQEVANEINAEALNFVARRVAAWYVREHGPVDPNDLDAVVKAFGEISRIMWSDEMMDYENVVEGPERWDTVISRNFALKMLAAAGTLEGYECPCPDLRAGWFEGMGVCVRDRRTQCLRDGDAACRFHAIVQGGGPDAPGSASTAAESPR